MALPIMGPLALPRLPAVIIKPFIVPRMRGSTLPFVRMARIVKAAAAGSLRIFKIGNFHANFTLVEVKVLHLYSSQIAVTLARRYKLVLVSTLMPNSALLYKSGSIAYRTLSQTNGIIVKQTPAIRKYIT